jgi:hypothetical protein
MPADERTSIDNILPNLVCDLLQVLDAELTQISG